MGLGFVTAVDPTQGQQGLLIGNFLTMLGITLLFATDSHYLVIAALNDSYAIFSPGETMASGDVASPLSILAGFLIFAAVLAAMMGTFLDYFTGVMHDMTPLK